MLEDILTFCHDDGWGVAYLQVVVCVAVFALGLPGFLHTTAIPEYVRRIQYRHLKITRILFIVGFLLLLVAFYYIWCLHGGRSVPIVGNIAKLPAGIITVSLLLAVLVWLRLFRATDVMSLASKLRQEAMNQLIQTQSKPIGSTRIRSQLVRRLGFKKTTRHTALEDLLKLVTYSQPGSEKDELIMELGELVYGVIESRTYTGFTLHEIIPSLPSLLPDDRGEEGVAALKKNYEHLSGLLCGTVQRLTEKRKISGDINHTLYALTAVGCNAARCGFLDTVRQTVAVLASQLPSSSYHLARVSNMLCENGHWQDAQNVCNMLVQAIDKECDSLAAFVWSIAALAGRGGGHRSEVAVDLFRKAVVNPEDQRSFLVRAEVELASRFEYDAVDTIRHFREEYLSLQEFEAYQQAGSKRRFRTIARRAATWVLTNI